MKTGVAFKLSLVGLLLTPAVALAQTAVSPTPATTNVRPNVIRPALRQAPHPPLSPGDRVQERREEKKENLQERQANLQERRENLQERAKQLRENIQKKREEAQAKFKAQRDAFKERLETIKDARKKALVERLDNRLAVINKNRTEAMSNHLQRMREILGRIEEKTANAKANGQDVSAVETAISAAETAITAAETAVANQAGKEYVANITYESTLKNTVGAAMKQLELDLKAVHQTVIEAKKAVADAAKALAKVVGQGPKVTPTPAAGEPTGTE